MTTLLNGKSYMRCLIAMLMLGLAAPVLAGECENPEITKALAQAEKTPDGGNAGNCNAERYGGWDSREELLMRVEMSYICQDPWIGQAIWFTYGRKPRGRGTKGECNPALYGNGRWDNYADLMTKARMALDALAARGMGFDADGNAIKVERGSFLERGTGSN